MFTRGNGEAAGVVLNRSLAIAEQRRNAPNQLQLPSLLHMFHHRIGDFKTTLDYVSAALSLPRPLRLQHYNCAALARTLCKAIPLRRSNARARASRTPHLWAIRVPLSRALVWAVSVFLWQAISTMSTQIG
jgi:hypothetical protein